MTEKKTRRGTLLEFGLVWKEERGYSAKREGIECLDDQGEGVEVTNQRWLFNGRKSWSRRCLCV